MSGGYTYGEHEPTENCPYCSTVCRADFVDIGVGFQQCRPYHCENCGASEIGPYDEERELTADEKCTGWYSPGAQAGSSANVIGGRIVSHVQAREAYRQKFQGNPLYHEPGVVEDWWKGHGNKMLALRPISYKDACAYVLAYHRHHSFPQGHKYSIGAAVLGELVGVVMVGRPVARRLQDGYTVEVTRLCTDGTYNACSFLYGAASRAAQAMGYWRILTYIMDEETGASLRAAGWVMETETPGKSWDQPSRPREDTHKLGKRIRYSKYLTHKVYDL